MKFRNWYYKFRAKLLYSDLRLIKTIKKKLSRIRDKVNKAKFRYLFKQLVTLEKYGAYKRIGIISASRNNDLIEQFKDAFQRLGITCDVCNSDPIQFESIPYIVIGNPDWLINYPDVYYVYITSTELNNLQPDSVFSNACGVFVRKALLDSSEFDRWRKEAQISKYMFYLPSPDNGWAKTDISWFQYYLYRVFLAYDRIDFDLFFHLIDRTILNLPNNGRICLNLPESADRRQEFAKENRYDFSVFPGLKHCIGWVGCALSYKLIFSLALEQGYSSIMVCEDDVLFPADFESKIESISNLLDNKQWSIFSGVIANVDGMKVQGVYELGDEYVVAVDRMISMVCNIYNKDAIATGAKWDEKNHDKNTNTIDVFLGSKLNNCFVLVPFLVKHKEDLDSTIWNTSNARYSDMICGAENKLRQLANEFRKKD